jgi:hypothetical protein
MGSETLIENCSFDNCAIAGLKTCNYNAINQNLVGGNIQSCGIGVWVSTGSVAKIGGTAFQISGTYDIEVDNSANDAMAIIGCDSESPNFGLFGNGVHVYIAGVSHRSLTNGTFVNAGSSPSTIERCVSLAGQLVVNASGPRVKVTGSSFGRSDWINTTTLTGGAVEIEDLMYGGTPNSTPGTIIQRARISAAGTQNYDLS